LLLDNWRYLSATGSQGRPQVRDRESVIDRLLDGPSTFFQTEFENFLC
jgi:hypothetical protein